MNRKLAEVVGQDLKWSQPRVTKKEYELRTPGDLVATLKFRSSWASFATAESADGCWTFKRVGFWQNRASIRLCDSETDLAVFTNNTWKSGGTLQLMNGTELRATSNFWQTKLAFLSESGDELVELKCGGVFRQSGNVEITPLGRRVAGLPLLVSFGWYLAVMLHSDATLAAAATAGG